MATILQRRLFSRTVAHAGGVAVSLATLMRNAPAVTSVADFYSRELLEISQDRSNYSIGVLIRGLTSEVE